MYFLKAALIVIAVCILEGILSIIKYKLIKCIKKENTMEKTLDQFEIDEVGVVKKVVAETFIKRRLFDMGITPGAEIFLRKKAPLGDPIEVNLRGYELTLRKNEAMCVLMEVKK